MNILIIIASLVITLGAQAYIDSMYNKTKKIIINKGMTGADIARLILDKNGLQDVKINESSGILSDHYDPRNKTVNLSPEVFCNVSVAAASVAAHECGHAIQDKNGYKPMRIRSKIIPTVNICTRIGYIAIIVGAIFSYKLIEIGIILLLALLAFQIITLPVEFNA